MPSATAAAQILARLKTLGKQQRVELLTGAYASPWLELLAWEGWRDGLEQVQLGKLEVQRTLGLDSDLTGGFTPDLDLTTGTLNYYSQASVDHLVVDSKVAADIGEPIDAATTVRVRDLENNRVTLVLADTDLATLMQAPWDSGRLLAGLAAVLVERSGNALVLAGRADGGLPPPDYVQRTLQALSRLPGVRTCTLKELLKNHPPGSRPVTLRRQGSLPRGYISLALHAALRKAHQLVNDLGKTTTGGAVVEEAHLLLYTAESRWWSLPPASPALGSVGLAYANEAAALARKELGKISLTEADGHTFLGKDGTIRLRLQNQADYPMNVEIALAGQDVVLPDGPVQAVRAEPGSTDVTLRVVGQTTKSRLTVALRAGGTTLSSFSLALHFV
ncbi:MAG: hypothetical protein H5T84_02790, partial [Thermoleophilia bacterium]|nr:hypothetical protein [Thermoleophilia bacterium]